jgi:hypothetical protein
VLKCKRELESDLAAIGETRNAKLSTERNNYGKERAEWGSNCRNRRVNSPAGYNKSELHFDWKLSVSKNAKNIFYVQRGCLKRCPLSVCKHFL